MSLAEARSCRENLRNDRKKRCSRGCAFFCALASLRETNPSPRSVRLCASYFDVFDFVAAVLGAGGKYSSVTRLR